MKISDTMKKKLILFCYLLGIPVIAYLISYWIDSSTTKQIQEALIEAAKQKNIPITEEFLNHYSVYNICAGNTSLSPGAIKETCAEAHDIWYMQLGAIISGLSAVFAYFLISIAGWISRIHRSFLVAIFTIGLYASLILGMILLVVNGGLVIAAIYYGESNLTGRVHIGVIGAISFAIILGVCRLLFSAFQTIKRIHTVAFGKILTRDKYPDIWLFVEESARKLNALIPDHIVVGLGEAFYVTAARVKCLDGELSGRTLFLSLSPMQELTKEELRSIIGHELGHFRGADTIYSKFFYPIYRGTQEALISTHSGLGDSGGFIFMPVFVLLMHFMDVFSKIESKFSRKRELIADAAGAELTSKETMASALTKIYAYSGVWSVVIKRMISVISEGNVLISSNESYAQIINSLDRACFLDNLQTSALEHPTDSHPPLKARMENLGFQLDSFVDRIKSKPVDPAIQLISDYGAIEKELTELEQIKLVRTGVATLPKKTSIVVENAVSKGV